MMDQIYEYIFHFDEGHLRVYTLNESDDAQFVKNLQENQKFVRVPKAQNEMYINLQRVKCYTRRLVDPEELRSKDEQKEAETPEVVA